MMLYENTKVKVRSPDGDIDYFDIVLRRDTLTPYLFITCLGYVLRKSIDLLKEMGFKLAKVRSRSYPAQTITDEDYADDIALLANKPAQAKSLERAAGGIGVHVNADKTILMLYPRGDISTLQGGPMKLVDKFTYLWSSVSLTEYDISTQLYTRIIK